MEALRTTSAKQFKSTRDLRNSQEMMKSLDYNFSKEKAMENKMSTNIFNHSKNSLPVQAHNLSKRDFIS